MRHGCRQQKDTSAKKSTSIKMGLLSAHRYPHPRMSEKEDEKLQNFSEDNLKRVVVENNVGADKGLGYRVVQ